MKRKLEQTVLFTGKRQPNEYVPGAVLRPHYYEKHKQYRKTLEVKLVTKFDRATGDFVIEKSVYECYGYPRPSELISRSNLGLYEFLDSSEVAQILRITSGALIREAKKGKIKHVKFGRFYRFFVIHVIDFVRDNLH